MAGIPSLSLCGLLLYASAVREPWWLLHIDELLFAVHAPFGVLPPLGAFHLRSTDSLLLSSEG